MPHAPCLKVVGPACGLQARLPNQHLGPISPYISLHLPTSPYISPAQSAPRPYISLHLPTSPYISLHFACSISTSALYLPTSPYISVHLLISPYIYLHLPISRLLNQHLGPSPRLRRPALLRLGGRRHLRRARGDISPLHLPYISLHLPTSPYISLHLRHLRRALALARRPGRQLLCATALLRGARCTEI